MKPGPKGNTKSRFHEFARMAHLDHPKEGPLEPSRVRVTLSAKALKNNFECLKKQLIGGGHLLPMVKANAYGHGAKWVVQTLMDQEGLIGFGVATLEEGAEIRSVLRKARKEMPILVFSGASNWDQHKTDFSIKFNLTPVLSNFDDLKAFLQLQSQFHLSYHLKFNTGMNRLGIEKYELPKVGALLKNFEIQHLPEGICSHLALSDEPDHKLTLKQFDSFIEVKNFFSTKFEKKFLYHLANSGAIWNEKKNPLAQDLDFARPGISLYGVPPYPKALPRGLIQVAKIEAQILQTRTLHAGDQVGYGGTFRVDIKSDPTTMAVFGAGYADGFLRSFSQKGICLSPNGKIFKIIGRVSMDLSAIECDLQLKKGDWITLYGPNIDPWKQAEFAGTIPYEILTSIGHRVHRIYE